MNRRSFLRLALCGGIGAVLSAAGCSANNDKAKGLRLSGPPLAESLPLLLLRRTLRAQGATADFTPWQSPDQLRALISGGAIDAAVLSLATAAVLHNRGVRLNVAVLNKPPLWIVSTAPGVSRLDDLHGQELCLPFGPGETPDILLRCLTSRMGAVFLPRHCGGALEAVNLLLAGRTRHAFLGEPAATLAVRRATHAGGHALRKAVDVQAAWAEAFPESPMLAHGALAVFPPLAAEREDVERLRTAYLREAAEVAASPARATAVAAHDFPALAEQAVDGVVPGSDLRPVTGTQGRDAALFLLARLMEQSPKALGGRLPAPDFLELGQ